MGSFKTARDAERAGPLLQRYMQIGNDTYGVVGQIVAIGKAYTVLRNDIAAGGDADDIAEADAGLALTVAAAAEQFATLADEERGWVDQVFAGLGYTRSE